MTIMITIIMTVKIITKITIIMMMTKTRLTR